MFLELIDTAYQQNFVFHYTPTNMWNIYFCLWVKRGKTSLSECYFPGLRAGCFKDFPFIYPKDGVC